MTRYNFIDPHKPLEPVLAASFTGFTQVQK